MAKQTFCPICVEDYQDLVGHLMKAHIKSPYENPSRRKKPLVCACKCGHKPQCSQCDIGYHTYKKAAKPNPPRTMIGRKVTKIETTKGVWAGTNGGALYGLPGGAVLLTGFFAHIPPGNVTAVEYLDEAKAKRENQKNPEWPWRHDFSKEKVELKRVKGGLLMTPKNRPLWAVQ